MTSIMTDRQRWPQVNCPYAEPTKIRGLEVDEPDSLLVGSIHGVQRQVLVDF